MTDLAGLTIVDLTRILSGPFCTMYFADMGAEVIKVEPPGGDDTRRWGPPFVKGESAYYLSVNRNKRSVVLDIKTPLGKEALKRLIRRADVVVENFRPGTLERLGFGFEVLRRINPRIILASISGFGQTGPYRDDPGYDLIAQGMGGIMSSTGQPGGPPTKVGFSVADIGAGMWAIIGILTALLNREKVGAQWIDVSLLDAVISWQTYVAANFFATGEDPAPVGNAHPNISPYQSFASKDGYFNVAVGNDEMWRRFCEAMGRPEWMEDPRFCTNSRRVQNRQELVELLQPLFQSRTTAEWVGLFRSRRIPAGPIYRLSELYTDPQLLARNMIRMFHHKKIGEFRTIGVPIHFLHQDRQGREIAPPPALGEHSREILGGLGFSEREIEQMVAESARK
ncbi:CaiB/BaiF CoA transferase family protein [Kyrpidia spormannii]|uniref:Acetyl-CoA:oxalate CoA-transferase n=1 Tax=Kyrpidia spormannii TaxID=2055160 RepID=A0ACA8ZD16_9BACL|nr:CoA transferase [Kyrpidia spormannii]CAB3395282.1 Acetyl-CoA:oxalate CoA-transferase [Kyrpidia spormannii]